MQVMQKVLTTSWFFITFYAAYFIRSKSHFYLPILNRFCLLLYFFNPVGKNHVYLQEFVLGKCLSVRHNVLSNWNSILGFLRTG